MNSNFNPLLAQQLNNNGNGGLWSQSNFNLLPHYEIIQVSGEKGADALQMGPNSSILLADNTASIVWLVKTDGAGYKTKIPYDVTPHQATPAPNINNLAERVARLEELYAAKSQSNSKQSRKQSAASHAAVEPSVDAAS